MAKVKIHSITSLITNSSTTIYTYSEDSEQKIRELFQQLIKDFGLSYSFDDLFTTVLLFEDSYHYDRYLELYEDNSHDEQSDKNDNRHKIIKQFANSSESRSILISRLYKDISNSLIPKPDWFLEAEQYDYEDIYEASPGTTLYINAKDEKYKPLADKLTAVIYSTTSEYCET